VPRQGVVVEGVKGESPQPAKNHKYSVKNSWICGHFYLKIAENAVF
jgi:hypothetical protein